MRHSCLPLAAFAASLTLAAAQAAAATLSHEGSPDPTCNGGQVVTRALPYNNAPELIGLARTSTGYLAAVRVGTLPGYTVRLVKLLVDGSAAGNFGSAGVVDFNQGQPDWGAMTVLQGPDTIYLGGSMITPMSNNAAYHFHVVRLTAAGALDTSFNGGSGANNATPGYLGEGSYDYISAITVLPSTLQVIVAGVATAQTTLGFSHLMAAVRLNGNGTTDTSFGNQGTVQYDFGASSPSAAQVFAVSIDSAFRVVLAGEITSGSPAHSSFAAVRFTSSGALDSCTGPAGTQDCAYTHAFHLGGLYNDTVSASPIDQNGRIYLVGSSSSGTSADNQDLRKVSQLRLTDQFQLDTTFNPSAGYESFSMQGVADEIDQDPGALVDANNRLLVTSGQSILVAARFLASGARDGTYNNGSASAGQVVALPASNLIGTSRVLLDGDRPVVASVVSTSGSSWELRIVRLLGDRIFTGGFQ